MKFFSTTAISALVAATASQVASKETAVRGSARETALAHRKLQSITSQPMQTFYVPIPEESMFNDMFYQINPSKARPPVESLISIAISTDDTVIWWDHWEDGFDTDVSTGNARSTEIWGDNDASNGCAPGVSPCTNSNDKLNAGNVIVIQNTVPLPRSASIIRYDGGDRIAASMPVAVTRGAYPTAPGSLMAGAVEVLATTEWGFEFEAPIGVDIGASFQAFQFTSYFFMAKEDNTEVTLPNGSVVTLDEGEADVLRVNQGDRIVSNKPIQVDLITGDVWSYYELRWYSLVPVEQFATKYVSPVGDSHGKTKVLIYNPIGNETLRIKVFYLYNGTKIRWTYNIVGGQAALSPVIPTGSGAHINGNVNFLVLSLTDTEYYAADGQATGSQWYDWGFPVVPRNQLTSQVLVGLGYGCTNNDCQGQIDRSVVWVSPVVDADIYVDYDNSGHNQEKIEIDALASVKLRDDTDDDMSGALIFAVKRGTGKNGPGVDIAAAWGQDPSVSRDMQSISLDLGTTVLPFTTLKVAKTVNKAQVSPGETMTYTIRVANVGQKNMGKDRLTVTDVLDDHVTYVAGSATYISADAGVGLTAIADGGSFPLGGAGFTVPFVLPRRGGTLDISFEVKVNTSGVNVSKILNHGLLTEINKPPLPFEVTTNIAYNGDIEIDNQVYLGDEGLAGCSNASEKVTGIMTADVTFCLKVTNTGSTTLADVQIQDHVLAFKTTLSGMLAPGESQTIPVLRQLSKAELNHAHVTANPVFSDGSDIPDLKDVSDYDPSEVAIQNVNPSISVDNKVYIGSEGESGCGAAVDLVKDVMNTPVTYCFTVTNTGDVPLHGITLANSAVAHKQLLDAPLAPGASRLVAVADIIDGDYSNTVRAQGTPYFSNGTPTGLPDVSDTDDSAVAKLAFFADITIENTVYLGNDNGQKCGTPDAVEYVAGYYDADVTYCFKVINSGETTLDGIQVTNDQLSFSDTSIGQLAPTAFSMLSIARKITNPLKNSATATGNPIMADGRDIPNLDDVTDSDPSSVGRLMHEAKITIENTVYLGAGNGGLSCGTSLAKELVTDYTGSNVTYCFEVKNTGDSYLKDIVVTNGDLGVQDSSIPLLAPGVAALVPFESTISSNLTNVAVVVGTPALADGTTIPDRPAVTDEDDSAVALIPYDPSISVDNKVYIGEDGGRMCGTDTAVEYVEDYYGTAVVYCFEVTNTGNTPLDALKLKNAELSYRDILSKMLLPGESTMVAVPGKIVGPLENTVTVTGTPSKKDGTRIGFDDVTDSDPSSVGRLLFGPAIHIDNTVYVGLDNGASCGTPTAVEKVTDIYYTDVTYCFNVTNTGDVPLTNIKITNDDIDYETDISEILKPAETTRVSVPGKIKGALVNTAVVKANPVSDKGDPISASDSSVTSVSDILTNSDICLASDGNGAYAYDFMLKDFECGDDGCLLSYQTCYLGDQSKFDIDALSHFNVLFDDACEVDTTRSSCSSGSSLQDSEGVGTPCDTDGYAIAKCETERPSNCYEMKVFVKNVSSMTGFAIGQSKPKTTCSSTSSDCSLAGPVCGGCTSDSQCDDGKDNTVDTCDSGVCVFTPKTIPEVTAQDPSEVDKIDFVASVNIENTVYLGNDGPSKCSTDSSEKVDGHYHTNVTYCFEVTNTGNTWLNEISLSDKVLYYFENLDPSLTLAPGESTLVALSGTITEGITNIANVTANPIMEDGRDIYDLENVKDSDPSEVGLIAYNPSVSIENTVYVGDDDGSQCDTGVEHATGTYGTGVNYCFEVTNTGDSPLTKITVNNTLLKFYDDDTVDVLMPGEKTMISTPRSITKDLTNDAVVTAQPSLADGSDIPNTDPVTDTDPSSVGRVALEPSINIENTVYIGSDGNAGCDDAVELVADYPDTAVTYCLTIKNAGDSYLTNVVVTDDELSFTDSTSVGLLAPDDQVTIAVPSTIAANLTNVAVVTADPALQSGSVVPDGTSVTDSDPSAVEVLSYSPDVAIDNVVYVGHDSGASCAKGRDTVDGLYGTAVTYCFTVTNVGDTPLDDVTITNDDLTYTTSIDPLAPGDTTTVTIESTITADLKNTAVVTGNPTKADGSDITDLPDVTASDPSGVIKIVVTGGIKIENKVYLSDDGGSSCGTDKAVESVSGTYGTETTYCFTVGNTGDTYLEDIVVTNEKLDSFTQVIPQVLAPGEKVTISVPGSITADLINTAVVTANPITEDGQDLTELADVKYEDDSGVVKLDLKANVHIDNTVYIGADGGKSCGTDVAKELVEGYYATPVVYCFAVTNKGETYLNDVLVTNPDLSYTNSSISGLAPGETVTLALESMISASLKNVAEVTANPTLEDGTDVPDLADVTDSDPSGVDTLEYSPAIEIDNTVYLGDDAGEGCGDAVEYVESYTGAGVVYCFTVTNTGDAFLGNAVVNNVELSFKDDTSLGQLAPGESVLIAFSTEIEGELTNIASVTAIPVTASGDIIPGGEEVTSTDPSSVGQLFYAPMVNITNTVYVGDDMGASCDTAVEKVVDDSGTPIVYCFVVKNTGDTHLGSIRLTNAELDFTDNSIASLAPGESTLIAFPSTLTSALTNNVVVVANPTLPNGADISGAEDVTSTDPSEVAIGGDVRNDIKDYEPPTDPEECIQDKWEEAGKTGDLVCATKEVVLESVTATDASTCTAGDTITVTVDASIRIDSSRNDLGWYVAVDGGDAMRGTCAINGLQVGNSYQVVGSPGATTDTGSVTFYDDDTCGDVAVNSSDPAYIDTPILVEATLPCTDDNEDGVLDFAICFTWRATDDNSICQISSNIPGALTGGCFCTRVDVPNIEVDTPIDDPVAPCR